MHFQLQVLACAQDLRAKRVTGVAGSVTKDTLQRRVVPPEGPSMLRDAGWSERLSIERQQIHS